MLNIEDIAKSNEPFDGRYALIRPLSVDGGTADVWLALDTNTVVEDVDLSELVFLEDSEIEKLGLVVAIKIYRPQNVLDTEGEHTFMEEFKIVYNCHHTNLIHPTYFSIYKETPYLVLPYCRQGSSELLIGNMNRDDDIWRYIKDVAAGLAYLHALNPPIIHQDIKPANVLLDDGRHYAITDFGISAQKGSRHDGSDGEKTGTLAYMAPERFKDDMEPLPESDVWAFGATLYELITGKVPFGEEGGIAQPDGVVQLQFPPIAKDIQRLICSCLNKDPRERPTAERIAKAAEEKRFSSGSKETVKEKWAVIKETVKEKWAVATACIVVLIAVGCIFWGLYGAQSSTPEPPTPEPKVDKDSVARSMLVVIDEKIAKANSYLTEHVYDAYGIEETNKIDSVLCEDFYIGILQLLDSVYGSDYISDVSEGMRRRIGERRETVVAMSEDWVSGLNETVSELKGKDIKKEFSQRADKLERRLKDYVGKWNSK